MVRKLMDMAAQCGDEIAVRYGLEVLHGHADSDKARVLGWLQGLACVPPNESGGINVVALLVDGATSRIEDAAIHIAAERGMDTSPRWGEWGVRNDIRAGLMFKVGPEAARHRFRDPDAFEALMDQGRVRFVLDMLSFPRALGKDRDVIQVDHYAILRLRPTFHTFVEHLVEHLPGRMTPQELRQLYREAEPLFTEEHLLEMERFVRGLR